MKTAAVSLLLGVSVLLLSGLTVSAVSLSVRPNLQQFFEGDPVSLSCVEDGQTVDGTVKRSKGGNQTEDCGTDHQDVFDGSSCTVSGLSSVDTEVYWCETSSGQRSDEVTITLTDRPLILEIPALPVITGSNLTLRCRNSNGETVAAFFVVNGSLTGSGSEHNITNIQQSDEGLYWCSTDNFGPSPQSWMRVRDPPTTTSSTTSLPLQASIFMPAVAALGSKVLLVLVLVGVVQLCKKQTGDHAARKTGRSVW